ncbi:MAG: hypothetical protein ACFE7R_09105, partial [Candidatus Hodarchaeota archaeon]
FSQIRKTTTIWHTPLIKMPHLVRQITKHKPYSLFVIGTRDPHYDKEILEQVKSETDGKLIVINDADHSMEVPGDIEDSIKVVTEIIRGIRQFLWPVDK